jgi:hypothetical protein
MPDDPLKLARREARELRQHLRALTASVVVFLRDMDLACAMTGSSPEDRVWKLGVLATKLELANDLAKRFGLGIDFEDPAWKNPMLPRRRKKATPKGG